MSIDSKKPSVYGTMSKILYCITSPPEHKNMARNLALIRNTIGKSYDDTIEIWSILFPLIPQEYLGSGSLSYEEQALIITLQLYAIGQQGTNIIQNDKSNSIGSSLHQIKTKELLSLDRRFNAMLTSTTFDEFTYHLRQIFKIGKSQNNFSVNFPALAEDLFWYQNGRLLFTVKNKL